MAKPSYRTRDLTECALMAALSALFALVGMLPPVAMVQILCPVPITWVGARAGSGLAWMAALIATAICFMLSSPTGAYVYLMPFGALGAIMGGACHRSDEGAYILGSSAWRVSLVLVVAVMGIEQILGLPEGIAEVRSLIGLGLWVVFGLFPGGAELAKSLTDAAITMPFGVLYPMAWVFCFANQIFCFLLFMRLGHALVPPISLPDRPPPAWFRYSIVALSILVVLLPRTGWPLVAQGLLVNLWLVGLFRCYIHGFLRVATWLREVPMPGLLRLGLSMIWPVLAAPLVIVIGGFSSRGLDPAAKPGDGEKMPDLAGFR